MKAYAIKDPKGKILDNTIRESEEKTFEAFSEDKDYIFVYYFERGYRCVPVEITEIKQEKKA